MNVVVLGVGNIGFTTARRLARDHLLVLIDRRQPDYLDGFLEEFPAARFIRADATDASQVEAALADCFPGAAIDVLLCTVGTRSKAGAVEDFPAFASDFDTNVFGNLVPIKAALERMTAAGSGKIVVLSSTSGHHAANDLTAYGPSKWALEAICGALRSELRGRGISVDVASPKSLRNRHSDFFTTDFGLDPDRVADVVARHLEQRAGRAYFVPRSYRAIRFVERLAPGVLDLAAGLRPFRRRGFRRVTARTAVITGASSGLGRELARLYAPALRELWLVARTGSALEALREELETDGSCRVHVRALDMGDSSAVSDFARELGEVDLLINNAGLHVDAEIAATPVSLYRDVYAANFLGAVELTGALFARASRPRKVVNILSTTAVAGRQRMSAYGSSKAALWAFTRSLRRVYGGSVQVLEVLPATFESSLFEKGTQIEQEGDDDSANAPPAARRLSSRAVAERVQAAEAAGRERLFIPFEARLFLLLDALMPPLFRRLFP